MLDEYKFSYYYTLRAESRTRVANSLNKKIRTQRDMEVWKGITLSSINKESIQYARIEWPKYYNESTHYGFEASWERLYFKYSAIPSHFNIAVWQERDGAQLLQGLALGKPSRGKTHLSLNWVERSFAPSYFRGGVLLPILAAAEEYAKLLGSERVLIKDAVDPKPFTKYGYTPFALPHVRGASFLAKELNHG